MVKIHPSLLAADLSCIRKALTLAEEAKASALQIDIMDGSFVPNLTFGPKIVTDIRKHSNLPLEIHLMVDKPLEWVEPFYQAGANYLIAHLETLANPGEFICRCRALNLTVGLAINPSTSLHLTEKYIQQIDILLLMGVTPGFHGQKMLLVLKEKLKLADSLYRNLNPSLLLEVDGGVDETNAPQLIKEGADILIMGSSFYLNPRRKELVEHLYQLSST